MYVSRIKNVSLIHLTAQRDVWKCSVSARVILKLMMFVNLAIHSCLCFFPETCVKMGYNSVERHLSIPPSAFIPCVYNEHTFGEKL